MAQNVSKNDNGSFNMNTGNWSPERWVSIIVVGALGVLILLRMGFRGVDVFGVQAGLKG